MFGNNKNNNNGHLLDFDNKNPSQPKSQEKSKKTISHFVVSLFGLGFVPYAPGTLASLVTLPIVWFILLIGGLRGLLIGTVLFFIIGYVFSAIALRRTTDKDPSFIVIDELVGQMTTFILPMAVFTGTIPFFRFGILNALEFTFFMHLLMYSCGFILFRFFDILKPFHVGKVDKNVKGALGVMGDDVVAGVYASLVLMAVLFAYVVWWMPNPVPMPVPVQ